MFGIGIVCLLVGGHWVCLLFLGIMFTTGFVCLLGDLC